MTSCSSNIKWKINILLLNSILINRTSYIECQQIAKYVDMFFLFFFIRDKRGADHNRSGLC